MRTIYTFLFFLSLSIGVFAQADLETNGTDANLIGHVVGDGEHLPGANVVLKGTTMGTATDITGHYQIVNLKPGTYTVVATALGFKTQTAQVTLKAGKTSEIKFELPTDALGLDAVVVTSDRNERARKDASVIVNTISPKLMATAQTITLAEGLNFCSGLRTENNCSNCGFNQVRINGLSGPHTQILVNTRPIFSGLAGVYGLELIPSNMIDRVEVIRGGGSALYGSNAIAGTINLILKDPVRNTYEVGTVNSFVGAGVKDAGDIAFDNTVNFNASLVSKDKKAGLSMYGFYRDRDPFDANNDGYSEAVTMKNTTVGARAFYRLGQRGKVSLDFYNIKEDRRGGNDFEEKPHNAELAEWVAHDITTGALTYDQFFREQDKLTLYVTGQNVGRDTYYGADYSLADYGRTDDFTYNIGAQYAAALGKANLTFGVETRGSNLLDKKLGYQDVETRTISDQSLSTTGVFAQYDINFGKLNVGLGARYEYYSVANKEKDEEHDADVSGNVISPRLTLKYNLLESLQLRTSYSQGYRAPQIFDEDLHIETSTARKILHRNADNLKQETTHSFMLSADFNKYIGNVAVGFLVEGFYTQFENAFVKSLESDPLDEDVFISLRENAEDGATVKGVNMELNLIPIKDLSLTAGFTVQSSAFETDDQGYGETKFLRTPDTYGFISLDYDFIENLCFSMSGTYTGSMIVPYHGVLLPEDQQEAGVLKDTDSFFDLGIKLSYDIKLNESTLQVLGGVRNIFNAYQSDLEVGAARDPGYIYGPGSARTVYFGLKFGNIF